MARRRARRARRRSSKKKSPLKILGIALLLALPVLYFLFTEFVFDPFEGSVGPFPELVPRDVDVYVRRERLDSDFDTFPMARELQKLLLTPAFREVSESRWYAEQEWIAELSATSTKIEEALVDAPFDPLGDLLGQEIVALARLPDGVGEPRYCYLARLSGKGRAAYELFDQQAVRDQIVPGAELREVDDADEPDVSYRRLDLADGQTWFFARELDMLVASSDEALVRDVLRTALVDRERSLGLTRMYAEELPGSDALPEEYFSAELFLDVPAYLASEETDEDLVERSADASTNMLRQIVDVTLWQDLVGRIDVVDGRLRVEAHAMLDSQRAASADTGIVGEKSFVLGERLDTELGRVPRSVVAAVTAKADISDLLNTVYASFSNDVKTLVNDALREMARRNPGWNRANNATELIDLFEVVLRGEFTIVARPIDHELPVDVQPVPALALVAPIGNLETWRGLERAFQRGLGAFGLGEGFGLESWVLNEGIGERVWFETSGLPFTELAYIVIEDELLVIGTDNDLVKEIIEVYAAAEPSLATKPDVQDLIAEVGDARANLAVWADAGGLRDVLEPYARWIAEDATRIDFGILRVQRRRELIDREYPQYRGRDDLPGTVEAELDAKLDELLAAEERERREEVVPREAEKWLDDLAWIGGLSDALIAFDLGERDVDVQVIVDTVAAP